MNTYKYILGLFLLSLVVSCSSDLENENIDLKKEEMVGEKTVSMNFNCTKADFDVDLKSTTRATASGEWENGDIVYLLFSCDKGSVPGKAVYNSSTKGWTVTYEGTLTRDKELKLQAYYFDGEAVETDGVVTLQPTTGVYRDLEGSYVYPTGDEINAAAHLVPATGRIKFKGKAPDGLSIKGISYYTSINTSSFGLSSAKNELFFEVKDGWSEYIYGEIIKNQYISIGNGKYEYTMHENYINMALGKSGYIQIPQSDSYNGWNRTNNPSWHDYVDLGLPSGLLWATCNIGANTPEEYGDYFAWGEVIGFLGGKTNFLEDNYKYMSSGMLTKYCVESRVGSVDNVTQLELTDDAANYNWKGKWKMPTKEDYEELISNCTVSFTTFNGVAGFLLTANNNNTIFFPSSGSRIGEKVSQTGDIVAWYWSATLVTPQNYPYYSYNSNQGCQSAFVAFWGIYSSYLTPSDRYRGEPIRACRNKF